MKISRVFAPLFILSLFFSGCAASVKEPNVAGAFYPSERTVLSGMVDRFLQNAREGRVEERPVVLISPHAGYEFSGQVAAFSYNQLEGMDIDTVIIIGSSHYASFRGVSVYAGGGMKTPLGVVKVNQRMARAMIDESGHVTYNPSAFDKEHSIEVQLPFLQRTLKKFTIVPVLVGAPDAESFSHMSKKLTEAVRANPRTMIVVSTDLSHYHDYPTAVSMDRKITDAIERMSSAGIEQYLRSGEAEACGGPALLYAMAAARDLGASYGRLFKYANSGDVTGDRGRVVGYAAMGLYKSVLSDEEKAEVLLLAKKTISEYVTTGKSPSFETANPKLLADAATFVTIKRRGMLRGCIGNIQPVMPLYRSVITNAVSASSRDYRFPPMVPQELDDIEVEVTVLSPLEPVKDIGGIRIGVHGLFLVNGEKSGIFLPQVPVEQGWDTGRFLKELSLKAGLPEDSWKNSSLFAFTADIIK